MEEMKAKMGIASVLTEVFSFSIEKNWERNSGVTDRSGDETRGSCNELV